MKKILFALLFFTSVAHGQVFQDIRQFVDYWGIGGSREFVIPNDTLKTTKAGTDPCRQLAKKNGIVYHYSCLKGKWVAIAQYINSTTIVINGDTVTVGGSGGGGAIDSVLMSSKYSTDTAKQNLRNSIATKQNTLPSGSTAQYLRGDLTLATFPTIPAQVNIIAGTNVEKTGTYPNVTISVPNVPTFNQLKDSIDKAFNAEDSLALGNGVLYDSINKLLTFIPDSMKTGTIPVNRLPSTGVVPGRYPYATVTVNEKGQVTLIESGTGGAGNTNLSNTRTSTGIQINSSTGSPTTIPGATPTEMGGFSAFDKRRSDTSTTFRNSRVGDTTAYSIGPAGDTIVFKGIDVVAGENVTVTKEHTQDKLQYRIAASGGGGGSADSTTFQTNYRADTMRTRINTALAGKQPTITAGSSSQYLKGDLTLGGNATGSVPGLMSDYDKRRLDSTTAVKNAAVIGDSLLYSIGPDGDTIVAKRLEFEAGAGITITPSHTQEKNKYVIASTSATSSSGTFTPTATAVTNVSLINNVFASYSRVGDIVTVYGRLYVEAGAAASTITLTLTLPVASNLGSNDLFGIGQSYLGGDQRPSIVFGADTVNDVALVSIQNNTASSTGTIYFSFQYKIN